MKKLIVLIIAMSSLSLYAHKIEGTLVLKGTIKTKINVNGVPTTCRVEVAKVKNYLKEDSFGNPAYRVLLNVSLDGGGFGEDARVRFSQKSWFYNIFKSGEESIVKDLEYASAEGGEIMIDNDGRIKSVKFSFQNQPINCTF